MNAGLPRRLAALVYEALLVAAIVLGAGFLLAPLVAPAAPALGTPTLPARVLQFCALFALLAAYFAWSWTGGRRTLAMKTWRLALRTAAGVPPAPKVALCRYLAGWIGPALALVAYAPTGSRWSALLVAVNYLWAWLDRDRAFLHDRIAGTRLVDAPAAG